MSKSFDAKRNPDIKHAFIKTFTILASNLLYNETVRMSHKDYKIQIDDSEITNLLGSTPLRELDQVRIRLIGSFQQYQYGNVAVLRIYRKAKPIKEV